MDDFRRRMYADCRRMGLEIVPKDTGARVMAWVALQGGDERVSMSPRLRCELQHLQQLYHIDGGEQPDKDFVALIQKYARELADYTAANSGKWPAWLYTLMEKRYGFRPYDL